MLAHHEHGDDEDQQGPQQQDGNHHLEVLVKDEGNGRREQDLLDQLPLLRVRPSGGRHHPVW